jgi:small subunit ribosomal protein S15
MTISKDEKLKIIKEFQLSPKDTGSPAVQIALLEKEIENLTLHLKEHRKDVPAKRSLLKKVARKKRLLRYLQKTNPSLYQKLVKKLGDLK